MKPKRAKPGFNVYQVLSEVVTPEGKAIRICLSLFPFGPWMPVGPVSPWGPSQLITSNAKTDIRIINNLLSISPPY